MHATVIKTIKKSKEMNTIQVLTMGENGCLNKARAEGRFLGRLCFTFLIWVTVAWTFSSNHFVKC